LSLNTKRGITNQPAWKGEEVFGKSGIRVGQDSLYVENYVPGNTKDNLILFEIGGGNYMEY